MHASGSAGQDEAWGANVGAGGRWMLANGCATNERRRRHIDGLDIASHRIASQRSAS